MRLLLISLVFSLPVKATLAQEASIKGQIKFSSDEVRYSGVIVLLENADCTLRSYADSAGRYIIQSIKPGRHKLSANALGYRGKLIDSLEIKGQNIIKDFAYPGPCNFTKKDDKPVCVYGHTNYIIAIEYGLADKGMLAKAKKGKIKLSGCLRTDCDPLYFCTLHKKEL